MIYDEIKEVLAPKIGRDNAEKTIETLRFHFGGGPVYLPALRSNGLMIDGETVKQRAERLGVVKSTVYRQYYKARGIDGYGKRK